eukprot:scaffold122238_cov21-Phaeocystis_antarctica.AAC.1
MVTSWLVYFAVRKTVEPGDSKPAKSTTLEATRSSTRGSSWALCGPAASRGECQAAQSHQARPEEAQAPCSSIAKGGGLAMLPSRAPRAASSRRSAA